MLVGVHSGNKSIILPWENDMTTLLDLFHKHVAASFDKQLLFAEKNQGDDPAWGCDMQTGKLSLKFSKSGGGIAFFKKKERVEFSYDIQVLGSEAHGVNTWLWIWANDKVSYPPRILTAASQLRELGKREGIEELTEGEFSCERISGENLALIASGVCDALAYFPMPYGGGCAYSLCYKENEKHEVEIPIVRLLTVFPQVISAVSVPDHKAAFRGYLNYYRFNATESDGSIHADSPWGELDAKFDEQNRLIDLSAKMAAPARA